MQRALQTLVLCVVSIAASMLAGCAFLPAAPPRWSGSIEHDYSGNSWGQFVEGIQSPQATLWVYCNRDSARGDITLTIPATDGVGTLSVLADGKLVARGVPQILRTDGDDNLVLNLYGQDMVAAVRSMMIEAKVSIEVKVDFASGQPFIATFNTNGSAAAGSSLLLACQATQQEETVSSAPTL